MAQQWTETDLKQKMRKNPKKVYKNVSESPRNVHGDI